MKTLILTRKKSLPPLDTNGQTLILNKKQYAQPPLNPYKVALDNQKAALNNIT